MIFQVSDPFDSRLDSFRWRDRQLASKLDRREKVGAGLFVAEGDLVVQRAIDAQCLPIALLCDTPMGDHFSSLVPATTDIFIGSEDLRREVTGLGVPLKATGLFRRPPLLDPDMLVAQSRRILVAESVDNPTNLGAIVRSAAALGWDALLLAAGSADPLARRALRVSMGTGLSLPFARIADDDSIDAILARHKIASFALTPDSNARDIAHITISPDDSIALLLGSERDGLDVTTMSRATEMIRIPMNNHVDSLNVSVAAAIAMYALRK